MHNKKCKFAAPYLILVLCTLFVLLFACKTADAGATDTGTDTGTNKSWTLKIDPQNGSAVTSEIVQNGQTFIVTAPTKSGYFFGGWSYTADGTSVDFVSGQTALTQDRTIFAIWFPPYVKSITKSIVGMREFAATNETQNIANNAVTLEFIVTDSNTAPDYASEVKNNPAKYTRKFTSTTATRQVYFSAKKDIKVDSNHDPILNATKVANTANNVIDLSSASDDATKNTLIKAANPGIILPASDYYIHVYTGGVWQFTSEAIHTQASPTSYLAPFTGQTTTNVLIIARHIFNRN